MAEVVAVAGEVGQHPADGDRHPDTDLSDAPGQRIGKRDARAKRDDRQHDGHARALDGAIEPVEQKQAADAGIKRPLNAQVQNTRREYLRLPRLHEDAHERICKDTHERGNDDGKRRAGNGRLPEALFEALFLPRSVVLRRKGGKRVAEILHGKCILTGYTDHVQLNLGEPENLEMVAIEDNEKNTMEIGAEPDSEEDFEFVCKKPQWVPEGYTLENEVHKEEWGTYEQCYTNDKEQGMMYWQMNNDAVNNLKISSDGSEQQEVMIENAKGYFIPDDVLDEERGNLVWEDGKYLYLIAGDLTKEELIRMAETIK